MHACTHAHWMQNNNWFFNLLPDHHHHLLMCVYIYILCLLSSIFDLEDEVFWTS